MCGEFLSKFALLLILLECKLNWSYNISPKPNLKLERPKLTLFKTKIRSSYFGFTVVLREKSVFISAPRDQSTLKSQSEIDEPGAIYKCGLDFEALKNQGTEACKPYFFETKGNVIRGGMDSEIRNKQWLGAAMVGGPRHSDPFLVCAPRYMAGRDYVRGTAYLNGICYTTSNTTSAQPLVTRIESFKTKGNSADFRLSQQGFSAHISESNMEFLMGAPGVRLWRGSVFLYDKRTLKSKIPLNPSLESHSYFGYAVSSGFLESRETKKIHYVATTIHSMDIRMGSYDGEVIVFDYTSEGQFERIFIRRGSQFGELFGYSLLVDDITNDLLDEIIVSAPLHQVDGIDVGAVYVYVNEGGFNFRDVQVINSPFGTQARFGTTMSKLGDINKDGYKDIAIAAPFVDGHGAVAIYLGGEDGLQTSPSKILGMEPPIEVKMFGHGLSNGFDIDDNGFNDLAVGAPESEQVFIYRTYPILDVEVRIRAVKPSVAPNETFLGFVFCYKINTEAKKMHSTTLFLDLKVDPIYKRMMFENNVSQMHLTVNATRRENCQKSNATIENTAADIFTPMTLHISFTLEHDAEKHVGDDFCTECAVLDSNSRKEHTSEVTFRHGCAGKECQVDLKITALEMPSEFILGKSSTLFASYLIESIGENTYYTKVEFISPFPFAKLPPNCKHDLVNDTKVSCSAVGSQHFAGNMTIELGFDVKKVQDVTDVNITAIAFSSGHEITPKDNFLNRTIIFKAHSAFEIVGKPNNIFESVFDSDNAKDIIYSFEIQNNGPSSLFNLQLVLLIPFTAKNNKNTEIRFLNLEQSRASLVLEKVQYKTVFFGAKTLVENPEIFEPNYNTILNEYVSTEGQISLENRTISLFCNQTNTENCGFAKMKIQAIKPAQKIMVNLYVNINPKGAKELLGEKFDYLQSYVDIFIEPISKKYVFLNVTKSINPLTLVNIGPERTPIWIYLAAGVGGIVFLLLLTMVLKKLGFFKRHTKAEMEEIVNEKLEKKRMRDELEQNDLNEEETPFNRED